MTSDDAESTGTANPGNHDVLDLTGVVVRAGHRYAVEVDLTPRACARGHDKTISCVCTTETGCPADPTQNPCVPCSLLDPYQPCPVVGFGAGEESSP